MKKRPEGRPTKYDPAYCKQIEDFFDIDPQNFRNVTITYKDGSTKEIKEEEANPLPTFRKFAKSIGVYHDTLQEWCKKHPEFSASYLRAKESQLEFVVENALRNNYQGYFSTLLMKNMFGWRDSPLIDNSTHQHTLVIENLHNLTHNDKKSGQASRLELIK